jgi:hypothetical protein
MYSGNIDMNRLLQQLLGRLGDSDEADNSPEDVPLVLESKDIPGLAKYIQSNSCQNICVMVREHKDVDHDSVHPDDE